MRLNRKRNVLALAIKRFLLIVAHVNDRRLELSGRNLAVEQDISLTVCAVLELRQEEVCHNPAHNSSTSPDISTLSCQVPSSRVEQLRCKEDHGNFGNVVSATADTSAQSTETDGRGLRDDGV